jgi:hypothetical protein
MCIGTFQFVIDCLQFLSAYDVMDNTEQLALQRTYAAILQSANSWQAFCIQNTNQMYVDCRDCIPRGADVSSQDQPSIHHGRLPLVSSSRIARRVGAHPTRRPETPFWKGDPLPTMDESHQIGTADEDDMAALMFNVSLE